MYLAIISNKPVKLQRSKRNRSSLPFRLSHRRDSKSRSSHSLQMPRMKILKDSENKQKLPWSTWKWTSKRTIRSSTTFFKVKTTALPKSLASRTPWRICSLYRTARNCQGWLRWDSSNSATTTTDRLTNRAKYKLQIKINFSQLRCSRSCSQWGQFLSYNRRAKAFCHHRTSSRILSRLSRSWTKLQKWTCWENKTKCWANNFTCSKFSNNNSCIINKPWSLRATTVRRSQKETTERWEVKMNSNWINYRALK